MLHPWGSFPEPSISPPQPLPTLAPFFNIPSGTPRAIFYSGKASVKYTGEVSQADMQVFCPRKLLPKDSGVLKDTAITARVFATEEKNLLITAHLQLVYILVSGANFSYPISGSYEQARWSRAELQRRLASSSGPAGAWHHCRPIHLAIGPMHVRTADIFLSMLSPAGGPDKCHLSRERACQTWPEGKQRQQRHCCGRRCSTQEVQILWARCVLRTQGLPGHPLVDWPVRQLAQACFSCCSPAVAPQRDFAESCLRAWRLQSSLHKAPLHARPGCCLSCSQGVCQGVSLWRKLQNPHPRHRHPLSAHRLPLQGPDPVPHPCQPGLLRQPGIELCEWVWACLSV